MTWYAYTPLVWPVLASAAFIGVVAVAMWRHGDTPGARPLAYSAALLAGLCLVVAGEISTVDPVILDTWFLLGEALMLPAALLALWFALEYAGMGDRVGPWVVGLALLGITARMGVLAIDLWLTLVGRSPIAGGIGATLTPLGIAFASVLLVVLLLGTSVLVVLFIRSPAHRVPIALILVGQIGLRLALVWTALAENDRIRLLLAVLAFDALAVLYAIALTRFRLLDVVPIARERIVRQMPDPILVVDRSGRIAALNPAAERLLGARDGDLRGRPARTVLQAVPGLLAMAEVQRPRVAEITMGAGTDNRFWEVHMAVLDDARGQPMGRLIVLHDVTALRRSEALLVRQERALSAAAEREHLARDLHDTVGQTLASTAMQADAIRRLVADGRVAEADAQLDRLAEASRSAHGEVRDFIRELHAGAAPQPSLVDTLRTYLDHVEERYQVRSDLSVEGREAMVGLPPATGSEVFHVVQEAVANAVRHGAAHRVAVHLRAAASRLCVEVIDDGRGFDVNGPHGAGFGLQSMQERASDLGGRVMWSSRPGAGTRVVLEVPFGSYPGSLAHRPAPLAPTIGAVS
jgi:PAS domain S-box-containing protein